MKKNPLVFSIILTPLLLVAGCGFIPRLPQGTIIDHHCLNLQSIPVRFIEAARANLRIAYGHTSHGSQITEGMSGLDAFMGGHGLYAWNEDGAGGALRLHDSPFPNAGDLGNPDYTTWYTDTAAYLDSHPGVNVIMWSWCGQVSGRDETGIAEDYLANMDRLESTYPDVRFIYMTGHLDGSGLDGNLHLRNEQIRDFCRSNGKWLFDFADIESYDPDGVYYGDQHPTDACNYDASGDGVTDQNEETEDHPPQPLGLDRNWAIDWQNAHTEGPGGDWYACGAAHSYPLNANRKAYAAWWLWARLAGWNP